MAHLGIARANPIDQSATNQSHPTDLPYLTDWTRPTRSMGTEFGFDQRGLDHACVKCTAYGLRSTVTTQVAIQPVCGENRVEHAVTVTKNAAQAGDVGVGQGTQRPQSIDKRCGVGPTPAFRADVNGTPARKLRVPGTPQAEQAFFRRAGRGP